MSIKCVAIKASNTGKTLYFANESVLYYNGHNDHRCDCLESHVGWG
jgi:hypothetical protein